VNRRIVLARLALGLVVEGFPAALAPPWTSAVASIGAVAVAAVVAAAAAAVRPERRHAAVSVAIGAAIVTCAFSHAGIPALAAEGLLILAYVLAGDAVFPARQLTAGVAATVLVAVALIVHPAASAWLTGIGLIAAVAAFTAALPVRGR
jgi:hypothetical protein